jgi:hypothetical protein
MAASAALLPAAGLQHRAFQRCGILATVRWKSHKHYLKRLGLPSGVFYF